MSRSHMLYNDTAINKVLNIKWKEKWQEELVFRLKNGPGATLEGKVKEKYRVAISDVTSGKVIHHYSVLIVTFTRGYRRSFDSSGVEIEPWKTSTKKVNTGYLPSSYKTVQLETSAITIQELLELTNIPEFNEVLPTLGGNTVRVFCNEGSLPNLEVNIGENVRLKTKGDGPYVEYIARIDDGGHVSSSEYVSGSQESWTSKIMSMKKEDKTLDQPDGVDDDEWDD